jgi:hypothetical protein
MVHERLHENGWRVQRIDPKNLPSIGAHNVIEIPPPYLDASSLAAASTGHREAPTLAQRCGLESKTEPPKVLWVV